MEAKATHQALAQKYVDQTLAYCLTTNTKFFMLTNVQHWQLYKIKPAQKDTKPIAELIHEVDVLRGGDIETVTEDFYVFSRAAYLSGSWEAIAALNRAANINDIFTILLSQKVLKLVGKLLSEMHGVKVPDERVSDILETQLNHEQKFKINRMLLKRLNAAGEPKKRPTTQAPPPPPEPEPVEAPTDGALALSQEDNN